MKKNFYFAALMGVLALSACSNEEDAVAGSQAKALPSMTIKLEAPKTYADTEAPVGNESKLNATYIFVNAGTDAAGTGAKYSCITLGANVTQTSVKYPIVGSTVYTLSNIAVAQVDVIKTAIATATPAEAATYLENYINTIDKLYIGGLTSQGSFIMSGKAVVNNGGGVTPYQLPIVLNRDIVKTSFKVDKIALKGDGMNDIEPAINSIKRIIISRGATKVHPFKIDGATTTGYELTPGWDQTDADGLSYVGDYMLDATDPVGNPTWATFGTINNTLQASGATDFTFTYPYENKVDRDDYIFSPFYVLPNYAESAVRGTIIILEAEIIPDGEAPITKYYKARLSSSFKTFAANKNTHYIISAQLKGVGTEEPNVGEDENDNLIVTVTVADWAIVLSDQVIE